MNLKLRSCIGGLGFMRFDSVVDELGCVVVFSVAPFEKWEEWDWSLVVERVEGL